MHSRLEKTGISKVRAYPKGDMSKLSKVAGFQDGEADHVKESSDLGLI